MLKGQGGKLNQGRGRKLVELAKMKSEYSTTDSDQNQSSGMPSSSKNKTSIKEPKPLSKPWLGQVSDYTGEVWEKFDYEHDSFMKLIDRESYHRLLEHFNIESDDVAANEESGVAISVTASVEVQNGKNTDSLSQLVGIECIHDHPLAPHNSLRPDTPQNTGTVDFETNGDLDGKIENKEFMQSLKEFYQTFLQNSEAGDRPSELSKSDGLPHHGEINMNEEPRLPPTSQPNNLVQINDAYGAESDKSGYLRLETEKLSHDVHDGECVEEISEAPHSCQQISALRPPDSNSGENTNEKPSVFHNSHHPDLFEIDDATGAGKDEPELLQHLETEKLPQVVPDRECVEEISEAPHYCHQINSPRIRETGKREIMNEEPLVSQEKQLSDPMEVNNSTSPGINNNQLSQSDLGQMNDTDDDDSANCEPPELQNLYDSDADPEYEIDTDVTESEEELTIENKRREKFKKWRKRKRRNKLQSIIENDQLPETSQSDNIFLLQQNQVVRSSQPGTSKDDNNIVQPEQNQPILSPQLDDNTVQQTQNQAVHSSQPTPSHESVKKSRKRQINIGNWQKSQAKDKRNTGQPYKSSSTKKLYPEKSGGNGCKESCRLKCLDKVSVELRTSLFSRFWRIGELQRQREFVRGLMTEIPLPSKPAPLVRKRSPNMAFYFIIDGSKVRVCKTFFMSVLGISHRWISTIRAKTSEGILEPDRRGRHSNHKRVDEAILEDMRAHIHAIPRIESHYLRAQTSRQFISGDKSISEIYRDYVKHCEENGRPFGTADRFRRLFVSEFNLAFFIPKKDQCDFCTAYQNLLPKERENAAEAFALHEANKRIARSQKDDDKTKTGDDVIVATFDLQKSLETPKGDVSQFYYKSKLSTYNLTIYELKTKKGYCNVWHEGEGKRGSIEIGSCVFKYIETKVRQMPGDGPLHFIFYSDNCGGQQKNKFLIGMYMCASLRFPRIASITHKYLVTGHTQNEGDHMHSVIEREISSARKKGPIYVPSQYVQLMRTAKKKPPYYEIQEFTYEDFIDFKLLQTKIGENFNVNTKGEKVPFSKIVAAKFTKEKPFSFLYKLSFAEEFEEIAVNENNVKDINKKNHENDSQPPTKKRRSTRKETAKQKSDKLVSDTILEDKIKIVREWNIPAYENPPGIPQNTLTGLKSLIKSNLIPAAYKGFYESLTIKKPKKTSKKDNVDSG